ncbi:MAG: hypothetical protein PHX93_00990 [Candidatus Peribacteraceae bacterium]|jgi:acyl carrier protein|nr:hypothetical protein [Candidatus Peribacteraceae bacterium]
MSSEEINVEKKVGAIVIDAIASHIEVEHAQVTSDMSLTDLESLDRQDVLMEIEEQCDRMPPLDKHNLRLQLPDMKAQNAKTVADLTSVVLAEVETLLSSASGDTQTR